RRVFCCLWLLLFNLSLSYLHVLVFLLTTPPPPTSTLFPYTTLFRSAHPDLDSRDRVLGDVTLVARLSILQQSDADRAHAFALERSEEHTSELQSRGHLVCRLLLEKKKKKSFHAPPLSRYC